MKNLWSMLTIMMVAVLSLSFTSCGSDDENDSITGALVGEWQECESNGVFRNDLTDREVMHLRLRPDGTGDWWTVSYGIQDYYKYSFDYDYDITVNGASGIIRMTITASTNAADIGKSESTRFTYENGILHAGEVYYKKK